MCKACIFPAETFSFAHKPKIPSYRNSFLCRSSDSYVGDVDAEINAAQLNMYKRHTAPFREWGWRRGQPTTPYACLEFLSHMMSALLTQH